MNKLITLTAISFLMVLTPGIASASASTFPATFNEGALYFVNSSGTVTTDNGAENKNSPGVATITMNQASTTSPEPEFFYGTLSTNLGGPTPYTFDFDAIPENHGSYHITGTDARGDLLQAVGHIGPDRNRFLKPARTERSINLRGTIILSPGSSTVASYSLNGVLFQ